jgi:arginyl-tRNA synthetase
MHVAKWIWNYSKNHSKEKIKADESWVAGIYVDAIRRLGENEKLQEEVDAINKKLEEKSDKKLNELWEKTRKICLDALEVIYKELNTHFDKYYFESEVEIKGKEIAQELVKKGIAEVSEEATIMNLEKYGLSVWVLLRKDGTVLYSSKDLALIERKLKENKLDRCIYIVADEQNLHFQQLFKTCELMKLKDADKCSHISYGLVRLPEGKMSSRTGQNILYSDFKKEVVEYAKAEIKKRFQKIGEKELESRALAISIAAIKFSMLRQGTNKIIVFSKEDALSFEGDTGPYIQYSYARASSILKKSEKKPEVRLAKNAKIEEKEALLIKKLAEFPGIVENSYKNMAPSTIANYSLELAHIFNEFYHETKVIGSDNEEFRLALVESFRVVCKQSLFLLGIDAIEEM